MQNGDVRLPETMEISLESSIGKKEGMRSTVRSKPRQLGNHILQKNARIQKQTCQIKGI
jgi:hypothetical protein